MRQPDPLGLRRRFGEGGQAHALSKADALWLPCGSLRDVVADNEDLRDLLGREGLEHEALQSWQRDRARLCRNHCDCTRLAELCMWRAEGQATRHARALVCDRVDFQGRYQLTSSVDDLLAAANQVKVAILIHDPKIASAEPAAGVHGRLPAAEVAWHQKRPLDADLPSLTQRNLLPRLGEDRHVSADVPANRIRLLKAIVLWHAGDGHALSHTVVGQQLCTSHLAEPNAGRVRKVSSASGDDSELDIWEELRAGTLPLEQGNNHLMRGGCSSVVSDAPVLEPAQEGVLLPAWCADHRGAREDGGQDVGNDATHVVERHHVDGIVLLAKSEGVRPSQGAEAEPAQGDGHNLGLTGGARGAKEQSEVIRLAQGRRWRRWSWRWGTPWEAQTVESSILRRRRRNDEGHARWQLHVLRHIGAREHSRDLKALQGLVKLVFPECHAQRGHSVARKEGNKKARCLVTPWHHSGDLRLRLDTEASKICLPDILTELRMADGLLAIGGSDGVALVTLPEQIKERVELLRVEAITPEPDSNGLLLRVNNGLLGLMNRLLHRCLHADLCWGCLL
mmetsp:Transcript_38540/g.84430  ORF Transcript_38540/g.84430 Transcript_38540/m.84430 type:complete len:565 (-) Transcript_38540:1641-3335(-)